MKIFLTEFKKLKRSNIILPLLVIPLISIIFGTLNYIMNTALLQKEWISLWTQVYLFYGLFFMPAIIGIICSYLWSGEHKRNNLNLILASGISFNKIIMSKMLVAFCLVLCAQIWLFILYILAGFLCNFTSQFPVEIFALLILASILSSYLIAIQSYISLKITSFAIPVVLALIISFLSLMLAQNNIVPQLSYVLSNTTISMTMNHLPDIEMSALTIVAMISSCFLITLAFIWLQVRSLAKHLKK